MSRKSSVMLYPFDDVLCKLNTKTRTSVVGSKKKDRHRLVLIST
jgi:hypothetical protein